MKHLIRFLVIVISLPVTTPMVILSFLSEFYEERIYDPYARFIQNIEWLELDD